jgi:PHD/YefM family antitoxin component YafN of YafNO toxin-antitoxin module
MPAKGRPKSFGSNILRLKLVPFVSEFPELIMVTRNGRERVVLLSADEYYRLNRLDRVALSVGSLFDKELAAIADAGVPAEYAHLDEERRS